MQAAGVAPLVAAFRTKHTVTSGKELIMVVSFRVRIVSLDC